MTRLPVFIASGAMLLGSGGVLADNVPSTAPSDNSTKTDADNQNTSQSDSTTAPDSNRTQSEPSVTPTENSSVPIPPSEDSTGTTQSNVQQTSTAGGGMGINQLVGVDIYNAKDEKVAEIKDLLMSDNNTVDTAIVTVGGVMGVAGRDVAIAWNQIQLVHDQNTIKAKLDMTEDQLKALPEYTSDGGVWHPK